MIFTGCTPLLFRRYISRQCCRLLPCRLLNKRYIWWIFKLSLFTLYVIIYDYRLHFAMPTMTGYSAILCLPGALWYMTGADIFFLKIFFRGYNKMLLNTMISFVRCQAPNTLATDIASGFTYIYHNTKFVCRTSYCTFIIYDAHIK